MPLFTPETPLSTTATEVVDDEFLPETLYTPDLTTSSTLLTSVVDDEFAAEPLFTPIFPSHTNLTDADVDTEFLTSFNIPEESLDVRIETKGILETYLQSVNLTKDNDTTLAVWKVVLTKSASVLRRLFAVNDIVFSVEATASAKNASEYGRTEKAIVTIYTINKTGITATSLNWKAAQELTRVFGYDTDKRLEKVASRNIEVGPMRLYATEWSITFVFSNQPFMSPPSAIVQLEKVIIGDGTDNYELQGVEDIEWHDSDPWVVAEVPGAIHVDEDGFQHIKPILIEGSLSCFDAESINKVLFDTEIIGVDGERNRVGYFHVWGKDARGNLHEYKLEGVRFRNIQWPKMSKKKQEPQPFVIPFYAELITEVRTAE